MPIKEEEGAELLFESPAWRTTFDTKSVFP